MFARTLIVVSLVFLSVTGTTLTTHAIAPEYKMERRLGLQQAESLRVGTDPKTNLVAAFGTRTRFEWRAENCFVGCSPRRS